jgi:hypothetical protein
MTAVGRKQSQLGIASVYISPGKIVRAKRDFTGVPACGSKRRERIPQDAEGIMETGRVKSSIMGEPDLQFASFALQGSSRTVCVSVDPALLSIVG